VAGDTSTLSARLEKSNSLVDLIRLVKDEAKPLVNARVDEFLNFPKDNVSMLFSELSFCVLTANWSAQGGIRAQNLIADRFINMPREELEEALRTVGHRFAPQRAHFIIENREKAELLPSIIKLPPKEARQEIVKHFKGIGWKEASHFLRNIGFLDVAILDKHILRLMHHFKLIPDLPKGWTQKRYESYEDLLKPTAAELSMPLGEMDLYLWYAVKNTVDK
jgi:N-glycosylase/DNA lyase